MKKIGVVICNYNGKEYADHCIETVLQQDIIDNIDIFMVDNASTDGSADYIGGKYGASVNIIRMPENMGGTGGFNRGIRHCLNEGYDYIFLLDNDASFCDTDTAGKMLEIMENDDSIGELGAKIMVQNYPDIIQECGSYLDFTDFAMKLGHRYEKDKGNLPELIECDYVAACAVIVRSSAVRKAGMMPEDTFIYWDDAEFGYRIKAAGYKVYASGKLRALHRGSYGRPVSRTMTQYYFTRNWMQFFAKYTGDKNIEQMTDAVLTGIFDRIFNSRIQGFNAYMISYTYAFLDFLGGIRGRAENGRVLDCTTDISEAEKIVKDLDSVNLIRSECGNDTESAVLRLKKLNKKLEICEISEGENAAGVTFRICHHVKEADRNILPEIWMDMYCNVIADRTTYDLYTNYKNESHFFSDMYRTAFADRVTLIRSEFMSGKDVI